jgi:hypothetical protein
MSTGTNDKKGVYLPHLFLFVIKLPNRNVRSRVTSGKWTSALSQIRT